MNREAGVPWLMDGDATRCECVTGVSRRADGRLDRWPTVLTRPQNEDLGKTAAAWLKSWRNSRPFILWKAIHQTAHYLFLPFCTREKLLTQRSRHPDGLSVETGYGCAD
jgi:hypothetical protein